MSSRLIGHDPWGGSSRPAADDGRAARTALPPGSARGRRLPIGVFAGAPCSCRSLSSEKDAKRARRPFLVSLGVRPRSRRCSELCQQDAPPQKRDAAPCEPMHRRRRQPNAGEAAACLAVRPGSRIVEEDRRKAEVIRPSRKCGTAPSSARSSLEAVPIGKYPEVVSVAQALAVERRDAI